ncbi:RagB/SusD family nutrient uptake outer membrane protein [Olivibacter ginsenosidimutans]|uniref:RagB/SusD family nutrient uptake outer membrane protein n=1 Tax=Olivibacter ginsenosidimutans TaxID=1176537 RepID=A0ABP9AS73_9SPHI
MKKITKYIGAILSILLLSACSKYLDVNPDMRAELSSVDDIKALLVTAYPSGCYATMTETASDNVEDKGAGAEGIANRIENESIFKFEDNNGTDQDYPNFYWNNAYTAIAAANTALHYIDGLSKSQQTPYLPYKGEALLCRAYAHFMLVALYAKTYNPATAATDIGVPYVTEPETTVQPNYSRGTVASVYEKIEQDLTEGLSLISDDAYTVPKYHFTKGAAHAFATRFYLFKQEYQQVIDHANLVYTDGFGPNLRPWRTEYNQLSLDQLFLRYTSSNDKANLLLLDNTTWYARYYRTYRFGVTYSKISRIYGSNVTGGTLNLGWYYYGGNTDNIGTTKFDEYFVYSSIADNIGQGHLMWPALTAEEALFNRAEANVALGNTNAALTDLTLFASKRVSGYNASQHAVTLTKVQSFYDIQDPKESVTQAILDLKRYEFLQEGMRWFDILRHGLTVTHEVLDGVNGNVVETITVASDDPRRQFQLPEEAALAGIELNPR